MNSNFILFPEYLDTSRNLLKKQQNKALQLVTENNHVNVISGAGNNFTIHGGHVSI
jgi:hypothetical protein